MKKALALALVLSLVALGSAEARTVKKAVQPVQPAVPAVPDQIIVAPGVANLDTPGRQVILVEAATGDVLYAKNADEHMATSSMSKVMTMYLVFDALRNGKLKMDDFIPISEHAWKQEGSRMFVKAGDQVKVSDLIQGVIVQSGNDAAVALAEALGGSEGNFAAMLNAKAHELGMLNSHFANANGMPEPDHYSSARDLATLALATMRDFPEDYHYYSEMEFTYNNIKQGNRNPLLYRNIGVDGLKTGHTDVAGYGLMASSVRDGRRLVLVINGLSSMQARADESAKVLDWGYREFGLYSIMKKGDVFADVPVWLGSLPSVQLVAAKDVNLSLPRSARNDLNVSIVYNQPIEAPVAKGAEIGKAVITAPGIQKMEVPLVAGADVEQLGFFQRAFKKIGLLFGMN